MDKDDEINAQLQWPKIVAKAFERVNFGSQSSASKAVLWADEEMRRQANLIKELHNEISALQGYPKGE